MRRRQASNPTAETAYSAPSSSCHLHLVSMKLGTFPALCVLALCVASSCIATSRSPSPFALQRSGGNNNPETSSHAMNTDGMELDGLSDSSKTISDSLESPPRLVIDYRLPLAERAPSYRAEEVTSAVPLRSRPFNLNLPTAQRVQQLRTAPSMPQLRGESSGGQPVSSQILVGQPVFRSTSLAEYQNRWSWYRATYGGPWPNVRRIRRSTKKVLMQFMSRVNALEVIRR